MTLRAAAVAATRTWVDGHEQRTVFPPTPEGTPGPMHLWQLIERVSAAGTDPGTPLVIATDALKLLGLPVELGPGAEHEMAPDACRERGWRVADLGHWTSFWQAGGTPVHMCVPAWRGGHEPGLIDAGDLAATTRRLAAYHQLTGAPFHLSPGISGIASLRDGRTWHRAPYWCPDWRRLDGPLRLGERDLAWEAPAPPGTPYVHRYDANTAYLAAAAAVEVASDQLQRTGPNPEWDRRAAGYWQITPPAWNHPQMPSPVASQVADTKGRLWVCTPTLALLLELADAGECGEVEIHDAYTAPGVRRVLRPWAEELRDALTVLNVASPDVQVVFGAGPLMPEDVDPLRSALKATYREGIGMFARVGSRVLYRPDWRHAVISQARVSLWRRAWTIGKAEGRWPARVATDLLAYGSHDPDPTEACPRGLALGTGLGKFHVMAPEQVPA